MTVAASCIQDEETKNNHHGTISRETPGGQRRAREKKMSNAGDKTSTTAKYGGGKSYGSLCYTAPGNVHLAWGEFSYF